MIYFIPIYLSTLGKRPHATHNQKQRARACPNQMAVHAHAKRYMASLAIPLSWPVRRDATNFVYALLHFIYKYQYFVLTN